jgi:hypothetical protein
MLKGLFVAGAVLAVAGCASTTDLLAGPPNFTARIDRPITDVRDCFADIGPGIEVTPYRTGYRVALRDLFTGLILISPDASGTLAETYGDAAGRKDGFPQLVRLCQARLLVSD